VTILVQLVGIYLIFALFSAVLVGAAVRLRSDTAKLLKFFLQFGLTLLFAYVSIMLLQVIFPTNRPFIALGTTLLIPHLASPSFPSSHAVYSAVCAGFLWQLREKWGLWAFVAVVLIGIARVMALVHYPLDVIVGVSIGILLSLFVPFLWSHRSA
jgi:undecaprenyl-diphosphatase